MHSAARMPLTPRGSPPSSPKSASARVRLPPDPDTFPPDYWALTSVILALAAIYFRLFSLACAALACIGASVITKTAETFDRLNTALSFAVVAAALLATFY